MRGRDDMVLCPCGGTAQLKGGDGGVLTFVCPRCGNLIVVPQVGRRGTGEQGQRELPEGNSRGY